MCFSMCLVCITAQCLRFCVLDAKTRGFGTGQPMGTAANNLRADFLPTREVPCAWPAPALAGWYCYLGVLAAGHGHLGAKLHCARCSQSAARHYRACSTDIVFYIKCQKRDLEPAVATTATATANARAPRPSTRRPVFLCPSNLIAVSTTIIVDNLFWLE
jgi:hypothetical protein